jgi:hypothetical protein
MRTTTLPKWVIEALAALLPGEEMLVAMAVENWPPRIELPRYVRGDFPFHGTVARSGVHQPEANKHGALSVRATNGDLLGVKPGEFRWLDCPLGAVGERVECIGTDVKPTLPGHLGPYEEVHRITISLTAEPEVKRVGEMTEEEAEAAGCKPGVPCDGGAPLPVNAMLRTNGWGTVTTSALADARERWHQDHPEHPWPDAWAWFCRVRRA